MWNWDADAIIIRDGRLQDTMLTFANIRIAFVSSSSVDCGGGVEVSCVQGSSGPRVMMGVAWHWHNADVVWGCRGRGWPVSWAGRHDHRVTMSPPSSTQSGRVKRGGVYNITLQWILGRVLTHLQYQNIYVWIKIFTLTHRKYSA